MNRAPGFALMDVREIIVHHSKTVDGDTLSAKAIRDYHVKVHGWDDVGYHYLVERVDGATVILVGRPADRSGSHCLHHNRHSIGICFVGDFDEVEPEQELLEEVAERLLVPLLREHHLLPSAIVGDRDHWPKKTCPGRRFDLDRLRAAVRKSQRARL